MGVFTGYLQREFARRRPPGWTARAEVPVLTPEIAALLGYTPRADVLLERVDGSRRLWIEFEISRADPVANHAKFATAHLFQPQPETDAFVSMVSPHVTRGRRNLASNAIWLMRRVGMRAFQTVLFPHLPAGEIQRLNQAITDPDAAFPAVDAEVDRVLSVTEPAAGGGEHQVFLAGEVFDVLLNVRQWNTEIASAQGRSLWVRRIVTYFVYDPFSGNFAPAKFCAYLPITEAQSGGAANERPFMRPTMTIPRYVTLDGQDSRFDGHRAHTHLTGALGMTVADTVEGNIRARFDRWTDSLSGAVQAHRDGPVVLNPPIWFR